MSRRVAFDETLEVTLLFPIRSTNPNGNYYAARTEDHGVVYIERQAVRRAFFEANRAPYTDAQFMDDNPDRTRAYHPSRRTCMFVLGIDEYNARMIEIAQKMERERLAAEERVRSRKLVEEQKREKRLKEHRERMARPSPRIGMTQDQVRYESNYGLPDHVNRTVTVTGEHEQWIYGTTRFRRYLYFRNGILYAIQN